MPGSNITYGSPSGLSALLSAAADGLAQWPTAPRVFVALDPLIGTALMPNPTIIPSTLQMTASPPFVIPGGTLGQVLASDGSGHITLQLAPGPADWLNAVGAYGADPTGVSDSAPAINSAIAAAAAQTNNGTVYLPQGTYLIKTPLVMAQGVTLRGPHPYGQGYWASAGAVLNVSASFTIGTAPLLAAIAMGYGGNTATNLAQASIIDLQIQMTSAPAGVDGIATVGNVTALNIHNVAITSAPGNGIVGYQNTSGTPRPDDWTVADVVIISPGSNPLLAPPAAPTLTPAGSGGTVAAGTYQGIVSYVGPAGESMGSFPASVTTTTGTSTITVTSPPASGNATGWYFYCTQAAGSTFTRQQTLGSPTAIGTNLVLSAPPTSSGAQPAASLAAGVNAVLYEADGVQLTGNDHSFDNVHVQGAGAVGAPGYGNGFNLQGSNIRATRCRSETSGADGYLWSSLNGGGNWDGIMLTGCSTQGSNNNGFRAWNSSGGGQQLNNVAVLTGCQFKGDGKNNLAGGGGYAGICVQGGNYVVATGCDVLVKTNSVATGCPQWALATGTAGTGGVPNLVQASGGFWSCVPGSGTVLWNDAAPANLLSIAVHGYLGTSGSPQPSNSYVPVLFATNPLIAGGLQRLTGGGPVTSAMIASAQTKGFTGLDLDNRYVWTISGPLVYNGVQDFVIQMSAPSGSIGYGANTNPGPGYISTGTSADGIQVYASTPTGASGTQGIVFRDCVIQGANPQAVVHFGGGQRRCKLVNCFVQNTSTVHTQVAAGSNGVAVTTFAGAGVLNVASGGTTGFPTAGSLIVQTSTGGAVINYTGTTTSTFTGCNTIGGTGNLSSTAGSSLVHPPAAAVLDDAGLSNNNSENQTFSGCDFAAAYGTPICVGFGDTNFGTPQHANDTLWHDCTTATANGLFSWCITSGGGHIATGYYDRSSPLGSVTANFGGVLNLIGGEDLNNLAATGLSHLVNGGSNSATVCTTRNLSQGANTTLASVVSGSLIMRGRCKVNGTGSIITVVSGGTLDLSDPSCSLGNLTVSGTGGNLLLAGQYAPNTGPVLTSWTGTTIYPGTQLAAGTYLCAPTNYAPASLTQPQFTTTTMAALSAGNATTNPFVAPASGSVVVTVSFVGRASAASCYTAFGLTAHGAQSPFTAGQVVCNEIQTEVSSSGTAISYNLVFTVTGLTAGNTYQFDLAGCCTTAMTFTVDAIGTTSATPTLGTGGQGGPVTMTVQAV